MGEELHEIMQNSSNEEYTENKHSEGSNAELDETEKVYFMGNTMAERNRILPLFHVQSIRHFCIILE